jgi:hypothetical protein
MDEEANARVLSLNSFQSGISGRIVPLIANWAPFRAQSQLKIQQIRSMPYLA